MENARRLQYLEAMGIDVWMPRRPFVVNQPSAIDNESSKSVQLDACMDSSTAETAMDSGRALPEMFAGYDQAYQSEQTIGAPTALTDLQAARNNESVWTELRAEIAACHACKLCETRTQTVFGVGSRHASWMFIGEAPGQNEDLQGEPFVGKAGQLLTEMLRAIGLKREEVFIANMLKCRPPNNRDPQADEVAACHDFLLRQIELIQPKIIVAVGRIAAQNLLKTQQPLAKLRGMVHRLDHYPMVVVHHPAYLLRSLIEKAKAWEDLQFALSVYQSLEQK